MTASALALIGCTVVISSFISGVFGMAGGMVLLGVLLVYFDVATGMVLFSILQITANGWRALHWRRFVLWPIFYWYVAGSLLAFAVMRSIAYVPDKATVYILLGLMPFMVEVLPQSMRPEHRMARRTVRHRHLYHRDSVPRRRRRAVPRHLLQQEPARSQDHQCHQGDHADLQSRDPRGVFRLAGRHQRTEIRGVGTGIVLALAGAIAAPFVVERMSDHGFRQWTRAIIFTIAVVYLIRGGCCCGRDREALLTRPDDAGDPHHVLER